MAAVGVADLAAAVMKAVVVEAVTLAAGLAEDRAAAELVAIGRAA